MNDTSMTERRKAVRVPVAIPVELHHENGFSLYATSDLSEGGAFFPRSIPHPVGARVALSFRLPGEEQAVRCQGEVVNVPDAHRLGMGVRFIGLSTGDVERLQKFTRARERN